MPGGPEMPAVLLTPALPSPEAAASEASAATDETSETDSDESTEAKGSGADAPNPAPAGAGSLSVPVQAVRGERHPDHGGSGKPHPGTSVVAATGTVAAGQGTLPSTDPESLAPTSPAPRSLAPTGGTALTEANSEVGRGRAPGAADDLPNGTRESADPQGAQEVLAPGIADAPAAPPTLPRDFAELLGAASGTHARAPVAGAERTGAAAPRIDVANLPPTPLRAVPVEIGLKALAGSNRFDIRLDPEELGRIDVRLEIDRERNEVTAQLVVDRVETFHLLRRDAGLLDQAFAQAGLTPSSDGINLSLRDPGTGTGGSAGMGGEAGANGDRGDGRGASRSSVLRAEEPAPRTRTMAVSGGLDIRI